MTIPQIEEVIAQLGGQLNNLQDEIGGLMRDVHQLREQLGVHRPEPEPSLRPETEPSRSPLRAH